MGYLSPTLEDIWANADYSQLLNGLDPRITKRRVYCRCPRCGKADGWVIPGGSVIRCNRDNNCGLQTSILGYLIGKHEAPLGDDFIEAVKRACQITCVPFPEREKTPEMESAQRKRDALAAIWDVASNAMESLSGNDGLDYLVHQRHFSEDFASANFGWLEDVAQLHAVLSKEELRSCAITEKWNRRIVIPIRDHNGRLHGLQGRTLNDISDDNPKYVYSKDCSVARIGGFGLDTAKGQHRIILCEGVLDVYKARQHGITNMVAAGTNNFSGDNLASLAGFGIREVVETFDADDAGIKGRFRLLAAADETVNAPDIYCADLSSLSKDPDEFIDKFGAKRFRSVVDTAINGYRYRAKCWWNEYTDSDSDRIGRYLTRCYNYVAGIPTATGQLKASIHFVKEASELTGVPVDKIADACKEATSAAEEKRRSASIKKLLQEVAHISRQGDVESALRKVKIELPQIERIGSVYHSKVPSGKETVESVKEMLRQMAQREFIGLPQRTFPTLDSNLLGLRGFILLAGGTNIGKTILLGQLAMDVVTHNDDACVVFISMEMTRNWLAQRLWSRVTQLNLVEMIEAFRARPDVLKRMEETESHTMELLDRIRILRPNEVAITQENILAEIRDLVIRTGRQRVMVIIDYLDILPTPPGFENKTQTEIDKELCRHILSIRDSLGELNPIVCVTEIRKPDTQNKSAWITRDDIIGSTRKAYATETILIWNRFTDRMIYEHVSGGACVGLRSTPLELTEKEWKEPNIKAESKQIKKFMETKGIGFSNLNIDKVRDGGTKGDFNITLDWKHNTIFEGLQL